MTQTASEITKTDILETIESVKASLDGLPFYDPRFREFYQSCIVLTHHTIDIEDEPLVDWLEDFVFDNEWALPQREPQVIVGRQREATPKGRRKLNISRSSSMGNPFVLKEHGGDCETAEEATNKYIQWLCPRLRDTSSKEYAWFELQSERLHSGEKLILGCCGHDHCHGVWIAHLLKTGDWRRWDTLDVSLWCDDVTNFLAANYRKFDAFEDGGSAYTKWEVLLGKVQFLDWDDDSLAKKRLYGLLYVLLVAHGTNGKHELVEGDADALLRTVAAIKETGEFPKNDTQKQQSEVDQLIAEGASKTDILKSAAAKGVTNTYSLERYADAARAEQESEDNILDAIDKLIDTGEAPEIKLADYVPAKWLPGFRVLKEGLKFKDDVLVATILCCVGAMLPPTTRIQGKSMNEKVILWLFLIGSSGTAKSVLMKLLALRPMEFGPSASLKAISNKEAQDYKAGLANFHEQKRKWDKLTKNANVKEQPPKKPEPYRKKNVLYTAPTTQGIRADMAEFGTYLPGLLAKDELSSWFKEMASPGRQTDIEFYLSAYDGSYSNEVFADSKLSREVEEGALSVLGGTQPKVFLEYLEAGNANGFNARPLFFQIERRQREILDNRPEDHDLTIYLGDLYEAAFELGPVEGLMRNHATAFTSGQPLPPPDMKRRPIFWLSEKATEQFEKVYQHLELKSTTAGSDEVEALWAKAPAQVLRWAAALQFLRTYTGMEPPSDDWRPPDAKTRWHAYQQLVGDNDPDKIEDYVRKFRPRVSAETIKLATKLVIAGKTTGVDLVERAKDPIQEMLRVFLAYTKKHTPKTSSKGVKLSTIRKNAWNANGRPSAPDIKQMAMLAKSRGLVVLVENGTAVRSVR